jgi:hypothetical protein
MFGLQERVSGPPLRRGRRIGGRQTIGALVILMYYTFASLANNMTLSPSPIGGALPVQPRPQTWFERNWKWLVPVLIVVALIVCGAFVGGVIYFVESTLRSSYPYQLAVKRATESPAVTARLGTPVHIGWFVSGNLGFNGSEGNASLGIPISGPSGKGSIKVVGKKHANHWNFQMLEVDVTGDDEPIPLLQPPPAPESGPGPTGNST